MKLRAAAALLALALLPLASAAQTPATARGTLGFY